ncbi:hypothetical protein AMTRI_Chr10g225020 [Amborella trichopoda]
MDFISPNPPMENPLTRCYSLSRLVGVFLSLVIIASDATFSHGSNTPRIDVHPKTLNGSGDTVTIEWNGIENPSNLDWLGIYNPHDSLDENFIGYVFLSSCENWRSGSCSISLPLINLRSDYGFRLFRWNESEINKHHDHDQNQLPVTKHLLAKGDKVAFKNPNDPAQIHLALTENHGEMRVIFVTKDGFKCFVRYGLDVRELDMVVEASSRTYSRSDMCDSPANSDVGWRDPGFIHDGVMVNLKHGKRYYYQVGSEKGGWSSIHSFVSSSKHSDETIAFLFGDMGTSVPYRTFIRTQEESISTVKWILRDIEALGNKPTFISHIGDISYARGYAWVWDYFFSQIEPLASKAPYHVCIGNHEYDWPQQPWKPAWAYGVYGKDGGGECGVPYSLRFHMPSNFSLPTGTTSPPTENLFYSVDFGVVHFLYFSTETDFLPGSPQYEFIKADLSNVNREKTPFVVVQGHRPMYTTSNELRDAPHRERMLKNLEPLFVKYKVDLALWGHVHRYERFCPLKNFTCGTHLPVHVVIGMAGQDWQAIWEPRADHPDVPIYPQPDRSLYRGGEFGYTRLHATRERLTLTYIGNHDGEAHDVLEIRGREGFQAVGSSLSVYIRGGGFLLGGALLGFLGGFFARSRRETVQKSTWIPVKSDDL